MAVLRVLLGVVIGFGIPFGFLYLILHFGFAGSDNAALAAGLIAGLIGAVYSAIAFGRGTYDLGPLSIVGYVLDMTWSLLNTSASLLVWLPACLVAGGDFVEPDDHSRRSGTFVYSKNPRGGGYDATTIGTVIAGGWSSHEEVHVWQARIFGPLYLPLYGLSWLLNLLFRLCTGKTDNIVQQAYYRVPFEDWAYSAGSSSGESINWGGWVLWFFLSLIYTSCVVLIFVGAVAGIVLLSLLAGGGLIAYGLIRAFTPTTA